MTNITKFDKTNLVTVRNAMKAALAVVEAEYGVKISLGNTTYSEEDFSSPLRVDILDSNLAVSKALASKLSEMGLVIEKDGRKLVDYRFRNSVNPFIYQKGNKQYKCSTQKAKAMFKA
jgi:hypothetical protein